MKKNFTKYYGHVRLNVTEGGSSRNNAIIDRIKETNCEMFVFYPKSIANRLMTGLCVLFNFLNYKNEKLFIHYSVIPYIFTEKLICNSLFLNLVFIFLKILDKKNEISFEINDLPYEQAIDLMLPKNSLNKLDAKLFALENARFVFSSELMCQYIIKKYKISRERTSVLINGGPSLSIRVANSLKSKVKPISLVYAGSLNRGRQIEHLIKIFNNNENYLYLLGDDGEWIKNLEYLGSNVRYLGSMDEKSAHAFVSKCDVGLIPYDDSRFYYNICCPTKAAFYITAGIPFISTNLRELKLHFNERIAIYEKIDNWKDVVENASFSEQLRQMKINIDNIYPMYEWPYLISQWMDSKSTANLNS